MRVRQTSVEAWRAINEGDYLSKKRLLIYNWLFIHGPATGREIHNGANYPMSLVHSRLGELREVNVVMEVGETCCEVTGMRVTRFDVTPYMPKLAPKEKKRTRKKLETIVEAGDRLAKAARKVCDGNDEEEALFELYDALSAYEKESEDARVGETILDVDESA